MVSSSNESSESQGRLRSRGKGDGNKIKQRRCHYHIISLRSIMNETHIKWRGAGGIRERGGKQFMEMTCVDRLNYNYYYLAFDVVRESNYKMLGWMVVVGGWVWGGGWGAEGEG